jgi:hypothetical protein
LARDIVSMRQPDAAQYPISILSHVSGTYSSTGSFAEKPHDGSVEIIGRSLLAQER